MGLSWCEYTLSVLHVIFCFLFEYLSKAKRKAAKKGSVQAQGVHQSSSQEANKACVSITGLNIA